ncbi:peptidoglycan DD-metalloendopeptidase family protein [Microcoleus sp. FACHB-1515]|uniref:murein hydrolase activator EnvC family protein n=1 Tax=Cyanophyceae TaxID=3028117 RepID=UPI001684223E|nr:M23 family metallopeptidase [Microcoleus sp. FACHB-1515]MBD2089288.1 peptidoglycan DD-metalloendopeptidase family protein [Microcoleus sp. FACHB-1515]
MIHRSTGHPTALKSVFLAVLLAIGLWLTQMAIAPAQSIDDLRQQQQQIEQQRSTLNQEQTRLRGMESAATAQLGGLQDTIQFTAAQIAQQQAKLQSATAQLQKLQADLAIAEKSYEDRQIATVARLRFMQRQQSTRGWAVLLQSRDLNEFLDRRWQLKRVYQADREILTNLQAAADAIERQQQQIEDQKNQIDLLTVELQAQQSQFQAQAETQQQLIDRLRQDRRALEAAQTQLEHDSENLGILIRQRLAIAANRNVRGTGKFAFPSDGPITSGFGMRVHPILGYRRLHAGIDFGGAYGSPIRAADAGTVIFAGWYGGYGKAVIVSHGDGLTTLYGHASTIYVSEGQIVQRGQTIAALGSTGFSTGPHLHFEVRQAGEPIDPQQYL